MAAPRVVAVALRSRPLGPRLPVTAANLSRPATAPRPYAPHAAVASTMTTTSSSPAARRSACTCATARASTHAASAPGRFELRRLGSAPGACGAGWASITPPRAAWAGAGGRRSASNGAGDADASDVIARASRIPRASDYFEVGLGTFSGANASTEGLQADDEPEYDVLLAKHDAAAPEARGWVDADWSDEDEEALRDPSAPWNAPIDAGASVTEGLNKIDEEYDSVQEVRDDYLVYSDHVRMASHAKLPPPLAVRAGVSEADAGAAEVARLLDENPSINDADAEEMLQYYRDFVSGKAEEIEQFPPPNTDGRWMHLVDIRRQADE